MHTILLIEPDAFLAGIYASKFEKEQLKVTVADSISEAKKKLKKEKPEAILVDVSIDEGAGFDFIAELREMTGYKKMPIIALTDLGDRESVERGRAVGASEYLIKGHFVPVEAAKKVKRIVTG